MINKLNIFIAVLKNTNQNKNAKIVYDYECMPMHIIFATRVSMVCRHWYEVACHPSLWSKVDFSYGWIKLNNDRLKWLCENRLMQLKEANFGTLKTMTNSALEVREHFSYFFDICYICKQTAEQLVLVNASCLKIHLKFFLILPK